ncbi:MULTISPECIES: peptide-methionine (S)-S-oxide reductase MsrA [Mesonia]|uniref:Peptide methionine sulfoxide reductase MsrA n=1 Tax=Mesonia oceanica TaxID=2687242 RepID=A0AC61YC73_9FLAO|nr:MULTISPECIES: peptide-methionine (S)-S-oxide reductase MsrA [Mesonia]MAN27115.1 peptide-methionine (S)-S-oxide reductase [Mesonia sp.]MAQ42002.1 peptide-methionine (S)-S-oxide reductase [Mesonia sp.]MBJ97643.1 peptide-methionine (S)-S-oxide reductase [Flavobacteriaceae bacterium]VVV02102.1 Peptide methionine sulfoxide reductase MsrA [Mesonia oceanica]|tara:strand:+ start:27292 stop:27837 length:546 start_codon:yes stop_codon:yes gene_type:complete
MEEVQLKTATFANGCFWCTEAVFQRLEGVSDIISGFTGGKIKNPPYREVVQGRTGHAEAIQLKYNPKVISYKELLMVFFTTHDPTTLNRQGNDVGTQYRSAIFFHDQEQQHTAQEVIEYLNKEAFDGKIVTEITAASAFYSAEIEHQNFYNNHPAQPYCQIIIDPKIKKLKSYFSDKLKSA